MSATLVDPDDLTPTQRRRLDDIARFRYRRKRNGFYLPGMAGQIPLNLVRKLEARGLVRQTTEQGMATVVVTGNGRNTLDIMRERAARKADEADRA